MKRSELEQILREGIQKILKEEKFTPRLNQTQPKKKGRYIPDTIDFMKDDRVKFKEHFKLVKNQKGEYKLYISPLMKSALDGIDRGRTGSDYLKTKSSLTKDISEKIPTNVRGLLKKYSNFLNPGLEMFAINTKIKEVTPEGNIIFFNPGGKYSEESVDDTLSEKKNVSWDAVDKVYYEPKDKEDNDDGDDKPEHDSKPYKPEPEVNIKSVIERIASDIFSATDLDQAKKIFIDFIKNTQIKDSDKKKMIETASGMKNLVKLQFYAANSLLKYEGHSLNQLNDKK